MSIFKVSYDDCDKRIKTIEEEIRFRELKCTITRLGLPPYHASTEEHNKTQNEKSWNQLKNYQNNLRLVKIEKMIYEAREQQRTATLPLLFKKYSEAIDLSLKLGKKVATGGEYETFAQEAIIQRDYIKQITAGHSN